MTSAPHSYTAETLREIEAAASELDQLFRQRHTFSEVEHILKRLVSICLPITRLMADEDVMLSQQRRIAELERQCGPKTPQLPGAIWLACWLHETYERMAPQYGYETKPETRVFDATAPNGKLMIAVCRELREALTELTHATGIGIPQGEKT